MKVDKVTVPTGDSQSFGFSLTGGPDSINVPFSLTDGRAPYDSGFLKPGHYSVTETMPSGWDLTALAGSVEGGHGSSQSIDPLNKAKVNIGLVAGDTVTCIFTDTQFGIRTVLSASVITLGESVWDSVILSGATADPGDTVTYNVYDDPYCSVGHIVFTSTKAVVTTGVLPDSDPFTPLVGARYEWQASYTGLQNHITLTDACGNEPLEVRSGQPPEQPPVGGDVYAPNKLVLLKPYLTLLGLFAAVATAVAITRGRRP